MADAYGTIGGMAFFVAIISGIIYGGRDGYPILKKIFHASGGLFVIMLAADMIFDIRPHKPTPEPKPAPVIEKTVSKTAPPKIERPEKPYYAESYDALHKKTGLRVTERWLFEYGEYIDKIGCANTHGFVEFNNDGIKRQFWLLFDNQTRRCLRVKIDSDVIYSEGNW